MEHLHRVDDAAGFLIDKSIRQEKGKDGIAKTRWLVVSDTYERLTEMEERVRRRAAEAPEYCQIEIFPLLTKDGHYGKGLCYEATGAWVDESVWYDNIIDTLSRVDRWPSRSSGAKPSWFGLVMETRRRNEAYSRHKRP